MLPSFARLVHGRLGSHEQAITELEAAAHEYTDADREADAKQRRVLHAGLFKSLDAKRKALARLPERIRDAKDEEQRVALREKQAKLARTVADLERDERSSERLTWRFDDPADAWRHQVLRGLVKDLRGFGSEIADVEKRVAFARAVMEKTVSGEVVGALWKRCIDEIAGNDKYSAGTTLRLTPQVGLVPLGKDRDSGLWEFWHPGSGAKPGWDGTWRAGKARLEVRSGIILVLVPGGSFRMGSQKEDPARPNFDPDTQRLYTPVNEVTLDPYFISKYELTQAQWSRIVPERPWPGLYEAGSKPGRAKLITELNPVEQVSWDDCTEALLRLDLALPTEAQWEYAARAGSTTPWWCGGDVRSIQGNGNIADAFAKRIVRSWTCDAEVDDGHVVHAPVGSFAPNPLGLHDVLGNVWEWCRDPRTSYEVSPRPGDGLRDSDGEGRVYRGGSFAYSAASCRTAYRSLNTTDYRLNDLGCRPAARIMR